MAPTQPQIFFILFYQQIVHKIPPARPADGNTTKVHMPEEGRKTIPAAPAPLPAIDDNLLRAGSFRPAVSSQFFNTYPASCRCTRSLWQKEPDTNTNGLPGEAFP